ncbi:MAG: queuosine 5'-phosphate N-glycosylase/hydrolase [Candidatus Sericytochromatia bacterium]
MIDQDLGVLEDARFVSERARHVVIDEAAVEAAGADFARRNIPVPAWNDQLHFTDGTGRTANYLVLLDGLNFSFWGEPRWGIDYRGQALRGYWALAAALKRAIEEGFAVDDARVMAGVSESELRAVLRGRGEIPLFEARLAHMRQIGRTLLERYDGQFSRVIAEAGGSAVALARRVIEAFPSYDDTSMYADRRIRLYKRAQILPADLYGAFGGRGLGAFHDIGRLTAFADYKVPQVLVKLGVMRYEAALEARIRQGRPLPAGSEEEVEIRAASIWGVERLRQAMARHGREAIAIEVDWILWEMGLHLDPEDMPYHRTRTTAY